MKKATTTKALPIMEIEKGTTIGTVAKMMVSPRTKSVVYFTITDNTVVSVRDCVGIGNDCVVIRSESDVKKIFDDRDIAETMNASYDLMGLKVIYDDGNIAGNVTEYEYDRKTGVVMNVDLDNGENVEASRILSIANGLVFITAEGKENAAAEVDETYKYLLGKTVVNSVTSDDKMFSVTAGTELTDVILAEAKEHDALLKLALNVD